MLIDVINQTVGDALSDLLLVETVLHAFGWSVSDWDAAYTDLPNRQMKVFLYTKMDIVAVFFKRSFTRRLVLLIAMSSRLLMLKDAAPILRLSKRPLMR